MKLALVNLINQILEEDKTVLEYSVTGVVEKHPIYSLGETEPVSYAKVDNGKVKIVIEVQS